MFSQYFENLTHSHKHKLIDLLFTRLPQREFHNISSHLLKSLKQYMQSELTIQCCSVMMKSL